MSEFETKVFTPLTKEELKEALEFYQDASENDELEKAKEKYGDIEKWNIYHVDDFSWIFGNEDMSLAPIWRWDDMDISGWDVSHVKNMKGLFCNMGYGLPDLEKWDVSNVENMEFMFAGAYFPDDKQNMLNNWKTGKVKNMNKMFSSVQKLYSLRYCNFNGDISNWDVSNCRTMNEMFGYNINFNQPLCLWKLDKLESANGILMGASRFSYVHQHQLLNFLAKPNMVEEVLYYEQYPDEKKKLDELVVKASMNSTLNKKILKYHERKMEMKEKEDLRDHLVMFLSTVQNEIILEKNKPPKKWHPDDSDSENELKTKGTDLFFTEDGGGDY